MAGIPFRSVLQPHLEYVRARRRAGDTWRAIAEALQKRGVPASASNVCEVYRRASKRTKWPAGLEPEPTTAPAAEPVRVFDSPAKEGGFFGASSKTKAGGAAIQPTATAAAEATEPGPPKPFRSRMLAHLPFIRAQRAAKQSWRQIAADLEGRGVKISYQAVASFFDRTQAREKRREEENAPRLPVAPFSTFSPPELTVAPSSEPDSFERADTLDDLAPLPRRKKPQS